MPRTNISIHPPRAGRDRQPQIPVRRYKPISIHPPRAGRDQCRPRSIWTTRRFQSTRPVRGGTLLANLRVLLPDISIHPPRAGRDLFAAIFAIRITDFNPPAPCGAGPHHLRCAESRKAISIHPPRAGRDQQSCTKFTPCILAQYTIQRAAKLLFAYQQAYFC